MSNHWIQGAIHHPGAFRKYASEHGGILSNGLINPKFTQHIINTTMNPRLHKEAVLARTLRKIAESKSGGFRYHVKAPKDFTSEFLKKMKGGRKHGRGKYSTTKVSAKYSVMPRQYGGWIGSHGNPWNQGGQIFAG